MNLLNYLLETINILLFLYLATAAFYMLFFALAAKIKTRPPQLEKQLRKFAVLIPGYKEDNVIVQTAQSALKQAYPANKYDVVIIADSFKPGTLNQLKNLPIRLIEVGFEQSTKSKALNRALEQLSDEYDVALILDADNIMEPDFIRKINDSFGQGAVAVQGRRTARNTDTLFSLLDTLSEAINNTIYNLGHQAVGLSSRLVGSAMAFEYGYFKKVMKTVDAVGGFDKELELKYLRDRVHIDYRHDALVFDEKVSQAAVYNKQRTRWIAAQFHYFRYYFPEACLHLCTRGNVDYFNKAYQMMLPPRLLIPGLLFIGTISSFVLTEAMGWFWFSALLANVIANAISIPTKLYSLQMVKAFLQIPKVMLMAFLSLFKLKSANREFEHTPHSIDTTHS